MIAVRVGDKVFAEKFCYDRWYSMAGTITEIRKDGTIVIEGPEEMVDYYRQEDILEIITPYSKKG
jgi:hypothetical protein